MLFSNRFPIRLLKLLDWCSTCFLKKMTGCLIFTEHYNSSIKETIFYLSKRMKILENMEQSYQYSALTYNKLVFIWEFLCYQIRLSTDTTIHVWKKWIFCKRRSFVVPQLYRVYDIRPMSCIESTLSIIRVVQCFLYVNKNNFD